MQKLSRVRKVLNINFVVTYSHKLKKLFLINLFMMSSFASSEIEFYGKLNLNLENAESKTSQETDFKNNASRIGIKSSFLMSESIKISFQIEAEIDPTDIKADEDKVFKERNTYIAISGNFGKVFTGTHDTAFKNSQLQIDQFNDTRADIKYILLGENRMNSMIGYTSPYIIKGLKISLNSISQSAGSYESISADYSINKIKASFAIDKNAKGHKGERFAIMIPFQNIDIGFLYQSSKKPLVNKSYSGHVISIKRNFLNQGSLYIQNAKSNMKILSGNQTSIGYSHKINNTTKTFLHYSKLTKGTNLDDITFASIGFEYKF
jgi:predicted porin|tara:strand:- start:635 stop:1597 length:963 start_codon:yes stop_codon:yes gene_type:complete